MVRRQTVCHMTTEVRGKAKSLGCHVEADWKWKYLRANDGQWVCSNFQVDFWAHLYFQPNIHSSQYLVDFLPLSLPSLPPSAEGKKISRE